MAAVRYGGVRIPSEIDVKSTVGNESQFAGIGPNAFYNAGDFVEFGG